MDPLDPSSYPRRILIATLGLAPQVLTETLYALGVESERPFVPTEIHVITTSEGAHRTRLELMSGGEGRLAQLEAQYGLKGVSRALSEENVHVIRSRDGRELGDIDSVEDNSAAADLITEIVRRFAGDDQAAMHVSIAGGRKTMGFLLGYALSLFGRAQDRLSHVLVASPYQDNRDFFFPPREAKVIHDREGRPASTADARILLAEIPVVRMRESLPSYVRSDQFTYSETVHQAQAALHKPKLVFEVEGCMLRIGDALVRLRPQSFALGLWLATRFLEASQSDWKSGSVRWDEDDWSVLAELYGKIPEVSMEQLQQLRTRLATNNRGGSFEDRKAFFSEHLSRLRKAMREGFGPAATPFIPQSRREPGGYSRVGIALPPGSIEIKWPNVSDANPENGSDTFRE